MPGHTRPGSQFTTLPTGSIMKKINLLFLIMISMIAVILPYQNHFEKIGGNCLGSSYSCEHLGDLYIEQLGDESYAFLEEPEGIDTNTKVLFPIINYSVRDNEIVDPLTLSFSPEDKEYVDDKQLHQRIWQTISRISPPEAIRYIRQLYLGRSEETRLLGEVWPISDELKDWDLSINMDQADDIYLLISTINHENGHLLSLNNSQLSPTQEPCNTYLTYNGCSRQNSYINKFYDFFWKGRIENKWLEIDSEDDDQLGSFYSDYEDEFVTSYAPTNPIEDFAESWNSFVFHSKIADPQMGYEQKINFFYQYPELVKMRATILANVIKIVNE